LFLLSLSSFLFSTSQDIAALLLQDLEHIREVCMGALRQASCVLLLFGLAGFTASVDVNAQAKADPAGVRVTLIGCIQRSQLQRETASTTVVPADRTKYVLSNITLVPDDDRGGSTAGTSGALLEQAVKMYDLDDSADSLIAPHVGDRVRVVGTVVTRTGKTTGPTEPPIAGGTRPPRLRVDSVQKISSDSATCSQ
jgi:hypothetical protein